MRQLIVFALGVALAGAGCIAPEGETIPEHPGSFEAPRPSGFNATGCSGSEVNIFLPYTEALKHMPPGFQPYQYVAGFGHMVLDAFSCRQLSVNGVDVGPGSWIEISISARSADHPVPPAFGSRLVYSAVSN